MSTKPWAIDFSVKIPAPYSAKINTHVLARRKAEFFFGSYQGLSKEIANMRLPRSVFFLLALLLESGLAHAICFGQPQQVYVGDTSSDSDCTYNDIQSALNAEGGTCPRCRQHHART